MGGMERPLMSNDNVSIAKILYNDINGYFFFTILRNFLAINDNVSIAKILNTDINGRCIPPKLNHYSSKIKTDVNLTKSSLTRVRTTKKDATSAPLLSSDITSKI